MPSSTNPGSAGLEAIDEVAGLLGLALRSVTVAQQQLHGEAFRLAHRMSQHIRYLRGVTELLMHEATREPAARSDAQAKKRRAKSLAQRRPARALLEAPKTTEGRP